MWTPYTTPRTSAIQCVCGADAVEEYTGEWVQCWGDACCGYWFHTTCVDMPSSLRLRPIFQCPSCCTSPTSSPLHPPQSIKRLFDCCQTNSWRLFHSLSSSSTAVDLTSFLAYQPPLLGGCNGLVVAAQVGALAILQDMLHMFSPNQVQSSVNLLHQTPLHVAILNGHLHCVPVLTQMQPRWHHVADVYSALPLDYLLQIRPAEVLPLLQDKPDLVHVTNPSTGNSIAHAICAIVPPDFASLLAVIPVSQLCSVNHHGQTPAMTLIQSPHVLRHHFELLVQQLASSPDWWTCVDDQGRSVLHFALMYKHPWALEVADLSRFRHFQLLHLAAECALPSAVALLVAAKFSPQQLHGTSRCSGATLGTGWWPILHATSPGCVLELLRVDTGAQLQYLYHQSQAHSTKVLSILNSIASHLPLYDFIQATAAANPHEYLGSRCLFLQRYRKCLRLDLKLTQLKLHVASLIVVPSRAKRVITVPSERDLWKVLQSAAISTWKCPIQVEIAGELHSSKDAHMWTVLASQLRQLGPHLFASSSQVFELLGKLIGHMVLVGQQLPSAVLPPSFLSTPAEFKPDLALDFKKGLDSVLPNALDNWNGYERFLLLHRVIFPQTMSQWKATKVHYDKPFHAHHPSMLAFWTVIEKHLVPQEQLVCRLRCGQPLRITPAPTVGIVEKSVLGIPEAISMDRLHVDLVLYIRGFRKHAKHT
ncbi:hypothetical protein DYB28_006954 [Aphanomyces astaci]|nr:hypothetical protein DYB28_006954 [Aphanomyces astaci]